MKKDFREGKFWYYLCLLMFLGWKVFPNVQIPFTMFSLGASGIAPPDFHAVSESVINKIMPMLINSFNRGHEFGIKYPKIGHLMPTISAIAAVGFLVLMLWILWQGIKSQKKEKKT